MPSTASKRNRAFAIATLAVIAAACHHPKPEPGAANPDVQRLGGMVGQPMLIAPAQSMRVAPELAWTGLPRVPDVLAAVDRAVTDTLRARVSNQQWVYADALIESSKNNPTYATDPRQLSVVALKAPKLQLGARLPEPLASQVRTMIALHEGRLVLIPVELRFERTAAGLGHPVLHVVLIDARLSTITWVGDVVGSDSATFSNAFAPAVASHLADLFVVR